MKISIDQWKPNKSSKTSLTHQIVSYFKERVQTGDWLTGAMLPSQRKLAHQFGVNRSTIVEAINELTALGIVETAVGRGTVIANNTWSLLLETPNWHKYIDSSLHPSNRPTIQKINHYEFDESYIRLSTGEISSDLMPKAYISKTLETIAKDQVTFNYLEPLGLYELRQELCQYLKRYQLDIHPEEMLIVSGSLQALQLIALSILGKDSSVFIEENSYITSLKVFDYSGITMKPAPTDANGVIPWLIDDKNLNPQSLLYTIPTFHNPTGHTMSSERRQEILSWCKRHQLPIIEDDAYRELYFDDLPLHPIKSYDDSGNVLYMGSVSKSLAPGMRIGWIVGPKSIIDRLGDIKMQTDYGASSVSQWFMTYFLRNGLYEKHLEELRIKLKLRRDLLLDLLDQYFKDLAYWDKPQGGFYIWLRFNKKISTEKLFELALEEHLLINPGYVYSHKKNNAIRLSFCYASEEQLKVGIKKLAEIVKNLQ